MYIKRVLLENVRCFKHLEIDFSASHDVQKWKVILGDNGSGKTTILRSIAMGLCDHTGAASLFQDTYGDWVHWGEKEATIKIDLIDEKDYTILTTINHKPHSKTETIEQSTDPKKNFPWKKMFVCGYGANRSIAGDTSYEEYSPADALYTLFDYKGRLQNPELVLWRLTHKKNDIAEICGWLDEVLMLENGSTELDEGGIKITSAWKHGVSFGSLPDGYQATLTFILDMLGWAAMKSPQKLDYKLSGIILIDEIEQHLHPSWQKYFIKLLYKVFPNLQFIATTHSPLCAIGTANLPKANEICSLLALQEHGDFNEGQDRIPPPSGERADQVLTSQLFGLDTSRSDGTQQQIERYSQLLAKEKRTQPEEKKMKELHSKLKEKLGSAETDLQQQIEKAVRETIDKLAKEAPNIKKFPQEAINFEIKRQLKELLD